jgi:hypothetical protein
LRVVSGDVDWVLGDFAPAATLHVDPYELARALRSSPPETVAALLDTFQEVDRATFVAAAADARIQTIQPDPVVVPPGGPEEGEPIPTEDLAPLVDFIEVHVGRSFPEEPAASRVEHHALVDGVPAGTFVSESLWELLFALGLVERGDDRLAADAVRREQVRGVCCPLVVRDTGDPALDDIVLVHELTHALDAELSAPATTAEPVDPAMALVEGNAHRVAFAYADALGADGIEVPEPPHVFADPDDPRLPVAVREILEFPYDEGRRFALELTERGGEDAIVEAFARPPSTSHQVLDVEAYLRGEEPVAVPVPPSPSGGTERQRGTLGAFVLRLLLEPELGADDAAAAAAAWAGDSYAVYGGADELCVAATVSFEAPEHAARLVAALGGATAGDAPTLLDVERCTAGA